MEGLSLKISMWEFMKLINISMYVHSYVLYAKVQVNGFVFLVIFYIRAFSILNRTRKVHGSYFISFILINNISIKPAGPYYKAFTTFRVSYSELQLR